MSKAYHKNATRSRTIARAMDGDTSVEFLTGSAKFGDDNTIFDRLQSRTEKRIETQRANKAARESRLALRKF